MEKGKLTEKQKEIVEFVTNSFMKLNETEPNKPFNVLDINMVNTELNAKALAEKELKIHNTAILKVHNERMTKLVEKLNEDFKRGGLPIVAEVYNLEAHEVEIRAEKDLRNSHNELYRHKVKMHVHSSCEKVVDGIFEIGYKTLGYMFSSGSQGVMRDNDFKVSTPEEFFNHEKTRKALIRLIEANNKCK